MRIVSYAVVAAALLWLQGTGQTTKKPNALRERTMFATNRYFSKGGLGIVKTNLYIVVKSAKRKHLS